MSAPKFFCSRAMAAATRSVTTALPAITARGRPRAARPCSACKASSSPSWSPSSLSKTSPVTRGACAAMQALKAAARSRRVLTSFLGSVM
jgi:hypothetical protein